MRLKSIVAMAVMILAASGCGRGRSEVDEPAQTASEAIVVEVVQPKIEDLRETITLVGVVVADEQVTVYSRVSGYLLELNVDIGDVVRRGFSLAKIDVPEMAASIDEKRALLVQAEAQVVEAEAAVGQHDAELTFRRLNLDRLEAIRERDADMLSQHDIDQAAAAVRVAESKLQTARAQIVVAEAAVQAARSQIEILNRMAEYASIAAPISGIVTERFVDPGALVQAASSSRTQAAPIVALARVDRVRVVADVPEPSAGPIARGTPVIIRVAGMEDRSATVTRTAGVLDPASRTLRIECDLANRDGRLKPGMTVRVEVIVRTISNALTVPVEALRGEAVFIVDAGSVSLRPVELGFQDEEIAQVTKGLEAGDSVALTSSAPLTDGAAVEVTR